MSRELTIRNQVEQAWSCLIASLAVELAPLSIIVLSGFVAFIWNMKAHLFWSPPIMEIYAFPCLLFVITGVYRTLRSDRIVAEASLYLGLWCIYWVLGVRLSYLAATLDFPMRDGLFERLDRILGFDWMQWLKFTISHPFFAKAQYYAYLSYIWQPVVSLAIFAVWGPSDRNRELLTSVMLASLAGAAISAALPALGPNELSGLKSNWHDIVNTLRSGRPQDQPFPYVGIITFPSFHTALAILFALAHRGNRWSFPPFLILNCFMVVATPACGFHYLVDVVGGALVAVAAFYLAKQLTTTAESVRTGNY